MTKNGSALVPLLLDASPTDNDSRKTQSAHHVERILILAVAVCRDYAAFPLDADTHIYLQKRKEEVSAL